MIRLVNRLTGSVMWVHPSRLDEYLEAGHRLASPPEKPQPAEPVRRPPEETEMPKKRVRRKAQV